MIVSLADYKELRDWGVEPKEARRSVIQSEFDWPPDPETFRQTIKSNTTTYVSNILKSAIQEVLTENGFDVDKDEEEKLARVYWDITDQVVRKIENFAVFADAVLIYIDDLKKGE